MIRNQTFYFCQTEELKFLWENVRFLKMSWGEDWMSVHLDECSSWQERNNLVFGAGVGVKWQDSDQHKNFVLLCFELAMNDPFLQHHKSRLDTMTDPLQLFQK